MLHSSYQPKSQQPSHSRFSRFALASVLLLFVCLRPAQAQWSVTYLCNGGTSTGSYQQPWPSTPVADTGSGVTFNNGPWGGSNVVTGTITPVFTWLGMFGPPPSSLDIRVTASANAGGYTTGPTVNDGAALASDGLGNDPTGDGITKSVSTGSHLFHLDNSQHAKVLTFPPVSLNATASSTWSTYCTVSLQAVPDTRAVTISANVDTTNMKAPALNPDGSVEFDAYKNIIFAAVPHTPDADGTMRGDYGIGYGSSYIPGDPDPDDLYPVNYMSHLAGTWGTDSTYSWYSSLKSSGGGGPTFTNVYIGAAALPTDAGPPLINPGETGKVDHIHLTVVDSNDGSKGTADYYMALHQPDDFLPSNQAAEYVTKEMEIESISAPGYASPGLTVNCTYNAPGAYWDYLAGGADVMAEIPGADEALPWFGIFCVAAGVAVDHLKPVPDTGGASFDPVQPGSTFPDEATEPFATTPHTYFEMKPHILANYKRTHLLHDTWGTTGFVSEVPINSDVYERPSGSFGDYMYHPGK